MFKHHKNQNTIQNIANPVNRNSIDKFSTSGKNKVNNVVAESKNYIIMDDLKDSKKNIGTVTLEAFQNTFPTFESPQNTRVEYLYNIVRNPSLLDNLNKYKTVISDQNSVLTLEELKKVLLAEEHALAALRIRITRFQIKLLTVNLLVNNSPRAVDLLKSKQNQFIAQLKSTKIFLVLDESQTNVDENQSLKHGRDENMVVSNVSPEDAINKPDNESLSINSRKNFVQHFDLTLYSTLKKIRNELTKIEKNVKDIGGTLCVSYRIPRYERLNLCRQHPMLSDFFTDIAPAFLRGIEPDYYYCCLSFLYEKMLNLTEQQEKQLETYFIELIDIYTLLANPAFQIPKKFYSIITNSPTSFNKNLMALQEEVPLTKSNFSRLVNAYNQFTMNSWFLLYVTYSNYFDSQRNIK